MPPVSNLMDVTRLISHHSPQSIQTGKKNTTEYQKKEYQKKKYHRRPDLCLFPLHEHGAGRKSNLGYKEMQSKRNSMRHKMIYVRPVVFFTSSFICWGKY